ncbi:Bax inhibitor-1/YccA family protein [Rhodococcus sp. X156]|uniref:Bax inhibitor-1/YccA family protein n=1 Tax=Rhodococcus sp. X156 TaxID=2499145 RepID=UPI000FD7C77C|nr:Bax inhibitor-1/YccA family protein [Rhodococcus sp. X156]
MRTSSNPVFRTLPKDRNGYATFGSGAAPQTGQAPYGQQQPYGQAPYGQQQPYGQAPYGQQPYGQPQPAQPFSTERAMTIDDVVVKTGMTLGVLTVAGIISALVCAANPDLVTPLAIGGVVIALVLVLVATFGRKMNPGIVLSYAAAEGVAIGAISFVFADLFGSAIVGQAVIGTVGVFAGMLIVYRTGAIRVTPKLTRMIVGAMIGILVLMVANLVGSLFGLEMGLRDGGALAIGFSLICIAVAAFSFLLDFDQADQLIRAGAPEKAAWGVALGLTVTLVWLYLEILRLLSYFQND